MFNFMLKNKRGFSLVELLVVVLLMGFGAVALMNLFQVAIKTFNAAEERYIKQEMVKEVSEYLQNSVTVISATMAEVYPDASVVPTDVSNTTGYAYIYVEKQDRDGDRDHKLDGYYLYILNPGESKETAKPLNADAPIYISIDVYEEVDDRYNDGKNDYDVMTNQCGVKFRIAAVDERFNYMTDAELQSLADQEGKGKTASQYEAELIEDNIFYDVNVSYHFPNMVDKSDEVRVNLTNAANIAGVKYEVQDDGYYHDIGFIRTQTNCYGEGGAVIDTVESVDKAGKALRVTTDTTIVGEGASNALSVASFCFIATAGFGEATGEVGILCDFRDQCLKTNPLGRMFVKAYYTVSPPIADFIAEHETLKAATRVALKPLVAVAVYALEPELLVEELPFVLLGIGSIVGLGVVTVVGVKRRKCRG